jgi:hypothetical protein
MKFAHISDVHLGGWKQPQLQQLNFQSFQKAITVCIEQKVEFVLISGDLFDSAYPPIEILKDAFGEFKRLKESRIPCFLIAGSHDYSVSGKTFLDVLERAGFCKNVFDAEESDGKIILNPTIYKGVAIYGYPGKKSGMEIEDLRKVRINDAPGLYKIFMLHTTIDKAKGSLPTDAIETELLPKADYYACGHLHIDFQYQNFVYPGPTFPNNFQELEDLQHGNFYIIDADKSNVLKKIELNLKGVVPIEIELRNAVNASSQIIAELEKRDIEDKIVLLRIRGELESGNNSDIKFSQVEEAASRKKVFLLLKNTHELKTKEMGVISAEIKNIENIEEEAISIYSRQNPADFNRFVPQLMSALSMEKQEGERLESFTGRLLDESRKILGF